MMSCRFSCRGYGRKLPVPALLLIGLLQRTPAVHVVARWIERGSLPAATSAWLRGALATAATLGSIQSLAGATQFVVSPASPISATVGTAISPVVFTVTGAAGVPGSYRVSNLPPGLTAVGAVNGVINGFSGTISGTPTAAGTFATSVLAFQFANATGDTIGPNTITFSISAANAPPVFTTQPATQSVAVGGSVTLVGVASGTPAPTYQWRKDGAALPGATTSTLVLANVQPADAGTYTLVATNSAGSATSNPAVLTVVVAPVITGHPVGQTITTGRDLTLTATASGTPAPTYQWLRNGAPIAGATNAVFTRTNVQLFDAGTYQLVATNSAGSATSNGAVVTVVPATVAPVILQQPTNQTAVAGQTVTFSVLASGSPLPAYSWKKEGVTIAGATAATLTLANVQAVDEGRYAVTIANSAGTVTSSTVTLVVTPAPAAPVITAQPISQSTTFGQNVTFSVAVTGTPGPTLQWRKDGIDIAGATNSTFAVNNVQAGDAATYSVVATNASGSVASQGAALAVSAAPVAPAFSASPTAQSITAGQPVTLAVGVTGVPSPALQWTRDGRPIAGATAATFTLASAQPSDAGSYAVTATNVAGTATSAAAVLTVDAPLYAGGRLVNLSILTSLDSADEVLTVGAVVGGAGTEGTKPLLVRAVGPSLAQFGLGNVLADPQLEFFTAATMTGANDDWRGDAALADAFARVGAFPLMAATSRDAAIFDPTVRKGDTSVRITGVRGAIGTVIAELYDATSNAVFSATTPRLINASVLKRISNSLTLGFVIGGATPTAVLVRAIGPSLTDFGVAGALANPRLEVVDGSGRTVAANDDWGGGGPLVDAFGRVGAFALGATTRDAAVVVTLPPGSYTAQVAGEGSAGGTVLVELYEVP